MIIDTSLYNKILQIVILIFPSIVTILVLINRRFYMNNLNKLKDRIDVFELKNDENTKQIIARVEQQEQKLSILFRNRSVAEKIREITKYAIQYCAGNMGKILTNSTEQFVDFVNSVLDQGFGSQSKEQILARLGMTRDHSMNYLSKFISSENYELWKKMSTPIIDSLNKSIEDIFDDPINDKNTRFLIKSQDSVQSLTREFITFASILKKQGYKNLCNHEKDVDQHI